MLHAFNCLPMTSLSFGIKCQQILLLFNQEDFEEYGSNMWKNQQNKDHAKISTFLLSAISSLCSNPYFFRKKSFHNQTDRFVGHFDFNHVCVTWALWNLLGRRNFFLCLKSQYPLCQINANITFLIIFDQFHGVINNFVMKSWPSNTMTKNQ